MQARSAAGLPQEDAEKERSSSSSSSSDEEDRRGQAPDSEQKASTSGRSEERRGGAAFSEQKKPGLRSRLWHAFNLIKKEVSHVALLSMLLGVAPCLLCENAVLPLYSCS